VKRDGVLETNGFNNSLMHGKANVRSDKAALPKRSNRRNTKRRREVKGKHSGREMIVPSSDIPKGD